MSEFKFTAQERADIVGVDRNSYRFNIEKLLDRIEQIISARGESDGWVRVSDRLPDPVTEVLCFTGNGYGIEVLLFEGDRQFYTLGSDLERSPTHWQPLPSPPKPDQQ